MKDFPMKFALPEGLLEATRLTQAGRLAEATEALRGLSGGGGGLPNGFKMPTIEAFQTPMPQGFQSPAPQAFKAPPASQPGVAGRFLSASFTNKAGSRSYKLYVPSNYTGQPMPLIVMLHGCSQSPDDFAAGTRMNEAAEEKGCLIAYPMQTSSANSQKCWNWFSEADQRRDLGEPGLIAGITREVMREYAIDPSRVYVAGLSAGGAAAAIMGEAYPDLYAAIGVHSGLACGAARDMMSAFGAMQSGGGDVRPGSRKHIPLPTIVFHGDRDGTVNVRNADGVVGQSGGGAALEKRVESGQVPGGYAYDRTLFTDANGRSVIEQYAVHGGGHAWFGGSSAGSYTDARGPNATQEMMRFFLAHPRTA